jgi:CSLREA domain-containing protein
MITALPFIDVSPDVGEATSEGSDPELFCTLSDYATTGANSVWYGYDTGADDEYVSVSADGYDTLLGVYEGDPAGGFVAVRGGCNDDGIALAAGSRIDGLRLRANAHYSIVVVAFPPHAQPAMTLSFSLQASPVYRVTTEADTDDGACDAHCSLREATQASLAAPGAVLVPAGHYAIISPLEFFGGAIHGAGMPLTIIDGLGQTRVLQQHATSTSAPTYGCHDLTLAHGMTFDDGGAFSGSRGVYAFDRVAVRDSLAGGSGGGLAIRPETSLSMFDSVVADNVAGKAAGGLYVRSDHFESHANSFVGNTSARSTESGGGIRSTVLAELRLYDTTIAGNRAAGEGGGLYIAARATILPVIANSSIVANTSGPHAVHHGGLVVQGAEPDIGAIVVTNTVIAGNHTGGPGGIAADCALDGPVQLATGHDFVQEPNGCTFSAPGDVTGVDPLLLPLDTFGGLLPVAAPAPGSPLIDAGDAAACTAHDALGVSRPMDGDGDGAATCDIGAVEYVSGMQPDRIFADGFDAA